MGCGMSWSTRAHAQGSGQSRVTRSVLLVDTASRTDGLRHPSRWLVALAVVAALLAPAGCRAPWGDGAAEAAGSSPSPAVVTADSRDWSAERTAWKPSEPVPAPSFTVEEAREIRLSWLERLRPDSAAGEPVPDLIAWAQPTWQAVADCMTESGFPVDVAPDDTGFRYKGEIPAAQAEAEELAFWRCNARYTLPPQRLVPWTETTTAVWYEYLTTFYLDCLGAHGVSVNGEVPSQDTWVSAVMSGHGYPDELWFPQLTERWSGVDTGDGDLMDRIEAECPPHPPATVMFGSGAPPVDLINAQ